MTNESYLTPVISDPCGGGIGDEHRLWNILNGEPYSCCFVTAYNGSLDVSYYRVALKKIPDDMAIYVKERMPHIRSHDEDSVAMWWWMTKSDEKKTWIEVCFRSRMILEFINLGVVR